MTSPMYYSKEAADKAASQMGEATGQAHHAVLFQGLGNAVYTVVKGQKMPQREGNSMTQKKDITLPGGATIGHQGTMVVKVDRKHELDTCPPSNMLECDARLVKVTPKYVVVQKEGGQTAWIERNAVWFQVLNESWVRLTMSYMRYTKLRKSKVYLLHVPPMVEA